MYIACLLWGTNLSSKRICIWCDNLLVLVVAIINSKHSKFGGIMDLVPAITILTLLYNFTFTGKHISRQLYSFPFFQMACFRSLAP